MKFSKLLRGAPPAREASPPRRRRRIQRENAPGTIIPGAPESRAVRPGGPTTIIPIADDAATPLARDLDAARERLRRAIPPVDDDE